MGAHRQRDTSVAIACCLLAAVLGGCTDSSAHRGGGDATGKPMKQGKRQAIEDYIARMLPFLQEHGFPDVRMKPVYESGHWKALVTGEAVSKTERGKQDYRIVLESVLAESEPPAEILYRVQYRVSPGD